jgi:transposase
VCGSRARAGRAGGREEVRTYQTMTRWLLVMVDRLGELGVTRVVMEATSDYWRGAFYLLEAHGFETWLVNARDVKHLPGRPKTDTLDAVWLCKVAERQMLRPSFVPPPPIRQLRHVTRYRVDLVAARTAEKQRVSTAVRLPIHSKDGASSSVWPLLRRSPKVDPSMPARLSRLVGVRCCRLTRWDLEV